MYFSTEYWISNIVFNRQKRKKHLNKNIKVLKTLKVNGSCRFSSIPIQVSILIRQIGHDWDILIHLNKQS